MAFNKIGAQWRYLPYTPENKKDFEFGPIIEYHFEYDDKKLQQLLNDFFVEFSLNQKIDLTKVENYHLMNRLANMLIEQVFKPSIEKVYKNGKI